MKKVFIFILSLMIMASSNIFSMDSLSYRIKIKDDNGLEFNKLIFGIHKMATNNIDTILGEKETPEFPPPSGLYSVFFITDSLNAVKYWSYIDFRPFGDDDFKRVYNFKVMNLMTSYTIEWPELSDLIDSAFVRDIFTGHLVNVDMKKNQSVYIENFAQDEFDIVVYYNKDVINNVKDINDEVNPMIYPNPSSDFVKIKDIGSFRKYNIVSLLGNNIISGLINNQSIELNISSFQSGIYYIVLERENGLKKVIKFMKI